MKRCSVLLSPCPLTRTLVVASLAVLLASGCGAAESEDFCEVTSLPSSDPVVVHGCSVTACCADGTSYTVEVAYHSGPNSPAVFCYPPGLEFSSGRGIAISPFPPGTDVCEFIPDQLLEVAAHYERCGWRDYPLLGP